MLDWIKAAKSHEEDPIFGFNPDAVTRSETFEIKAPSKVVWDILTDLPRYNEWNPFCIRAVSSLKMGDPIDMTLINYATAGGPTVPNLEYICGYEPERLLSWEFPNLDFWPYPARRDQVIEPIGPNSCRYYSTDAFLGANGIHVFRFAGPWIKRAFDDSGLALKARAEALFAAGTATG